MSFELTYNVVPLAEVPMSNSEHKDEPIRPVILVVDDERVIADTLAVILTRSGFSVFAAYNAAHALELAATVRPDLLLSDVMMCPGMDGTQLAIAMVKRFPNCKILLFSGNAATSDLLYEAREAGHDFVLLEKPVHPSDLLARISQTLMVS